MEWQISKAKAITPLLSLLLSVSICALANQKYSNAISNMLRLTSLNQAFVFFEGIVPRFSNRCKSALQAFSSLNETMK